MVGAWPVTWRVCRRRRRIGAGPDRGPDRPFTGLPSPDAAEINAGAQALLIGQSRLAALVAATSGRAKFDDGFTAPGFIAQFKVAMEAGPIALLSPIGSAAISKMMQDGLLDSTDVIVMNAILVRSSFATLATPSSFIGVRAGDRAQLTHPWARQGAE